MQKINIKLITLISVLLFNLIVAQNSTTISPKLIIDLVGTHTANAQGQEGSSSVNNSTTLSVEVVHNTEGIFSIGGGIMYLFPREQEFEGSGEFNFIPIYTICQIRMRDDESNYFPSIIANLGYNLIFNGDQAYRGSFSISGGMYIAGGLRVSMSSVFVEALYKSFGGSVSIRRDSDKKKIGDVNYTTISLGVGFLL